MCQIIRMCYFGRMEIRCLYDELVDVKTLKPNKRNRNKHSIEQIEKLSKLLSYQGMRAPIIISKLSGEIVKGHCTLDAIKKLGVKKAPVVYQDFKDLDVEYAFVQSDNSISSWSDLDLTGINSDIGDLGPDFDIDLLGIKNFTLDIAEFEFDPSSKDNDKPHKVCPKCGEII